ncbi:TIGR00645 family protein [Terrarubrum flagellatum]|uniref:TIGR00645 family protein n=1 Tax=Terrirubrum flagellatum TaxID=2895980 RepID=UPI003145168F
MTDPDLPAPRPGESDRHRTIVERFIEKIIFNSRWLLAPFYLALVVALVILLFKMLIETGEYVLHALSATESDIILGALSLVDLALTGSLIIIVIFSGYENFVSRIDEAEHSDWPEWMAKIDFTGLKLKLLSSIVAISAIKLLTAFMNVTKYTDRDLGWMAGVHVVFVISGVLMAWTDKISGEAKATKDH